MDFAEEKRNLEATREKLLAQLNYVGGQIALLDRLMGAPPAPDPPAPANRAARRRAKANGAAVTSP
jgi:hypothetical protein